VTTDRPLRLADPTATPEDVAAVAEVLRGGQLAEGPEVAAFEREFGDRFCPGRHPTAVSSGTAALHTGLLATTGNKRFPLDTEPDEVIVPAFTFAATANAIVHAGLAPVFVDIDPVTYCLDPAAVEAAVTERTVGIMVVHLYGHPADLPALSSIATRHQLAIYEDCAQAHGAALGGIPVGLTGVFSAWSLYATKNLTTGEGGMVACQSRTAQYRASCLNAHEGCYRGGSGAYHPGYNFRMTEFQAALGRSRLRRFATAQITRARNAELLTEGLRDVVTTPTVIPGATHAWHQYTIRVPRDSRTQIAEALAQQGIETRVFYRRPVHRHPAMAGFGIPRFLPETERAAAEVLSLPVHPGIHPVDVDRIVTAVRGAVGAGS
jgi:perosamine synthetase